MKNYFTAIGIVFLLASCGGNQRDTDTTEPTEKKPTETKRFDTRRLEGLYMGEFGKATLMVQINYAQGKNASGFNILRGNRRNIKGSLENKGDRFYFVLEEPGNDKYDGRFEFDIDTTEFLLSGKWIPNDPQAASAREYQLKRMDSLMVNTEIIGEWHAELWGIYATAEFKKDGTVSINGNYYEESGDINEEVIVNGTWLEEGEKIRIELSKHKRVKKQLIILTRHDEPEMPDMFYLKESDKVVFYPLGMYF